MAGGEIFVEDAREVGGGDAAAGVGDRDGDAAGVEKMTEEIKTRYARLFKV